MAGSDPTRTMIPDGQPDAAPADAVLSEFPERIGRYRVEQVLGRGGFGLVYLAHDEQLNRPVAVKVPHAKLISGPEDAAAYLAEARTVANLDHPHIVPVYDVGSTAEFPCYVVSKYIAGVDLSKRLKQSRLTAIETAEVVATVAEALHYAHKQGLVHRDVKPGNILIDTSGKPFVVDFGLALREQDVGHGPKFAGTPAYMSPEQARSEGHRVDGRSDIFSLGVVFYELLVGRRPFKGDSRDELLEQITTYEPRPPRQCDDSLPKELERICLKALSKRATERYSTAKDMAEDLRFFLAQPPATGSTTAPGSATAQPASPSAATSPPTPSSPGTSTPTPAATPAGADSATNKASGSGSSSDSRPVKIVPKGLRSFDEHDADFFLELLPGPRDREGLPDSLRFWKTRIEETDADQTFSVGLIYGPSGCGKSSLVKAGLLPRLSQNVVAVYLEATADETEKRLLNGLRKRCPALADNLTLTETLARLRRGQGIPVGKKVLIVLDQFEQWLHSRKEQPNTELVQALRQCDGGHVQCIVMVRDDFWMAATRFMQELEIRLLEGHNSAAVDLFDLNHARIVLMAFGRAFGKLPEHGGGTSKDQKEFLAQAITGLAQEGKVISVRLALFAEMLKGKPWTSATLKDVGGAEGVGVTFLEETFSATSAPPERRYHQTAARAVLAALLPESGTDIKGHMRSQQKLLDASGYAARPKAFDDLLRILDSEIRLITPTDPEGAECATPLRGVSNDDTSVVDRAASHGANQDPTHAAERRGTLKYYQLTHDYVVPSLRDWLTRKQKETRRGRAELRLADRAATWNARPENRHLPSLREYLSIRLLTDKTRWNGTQRKMMREAGRVHAVRSGLVTVLLLIVALTGVSIRTAVVNQQNITRAEGLVAGLLKADIAQIPAIIAEIEPYREWADPLLRQENDKAAANSRQKLHTSLALLPVDATQVKFLYNRLLDATPPEVPVIRDALAPHNYALLHKLWAVAEKPDNGKESQRLRAAAALAKYAPDSQRWNKSSEAVVDQLVAENPVFLVLWMDGFRPIQGKLLASLASIYRDIKGRESQRTLATNILADYAADKPAVLFDLLADAEQFQFAALYNKLKEHRQRAIALCTAELARRPAGNAGEEDKEHLAKRQANTGVALLRLGKSEQVWPLLKHSPDPRVRSYLIHWLSPLGGDPAAIVARLDHESDVTIRRALVLTLGEYTETQLPMSDRTPLIKKLLGIYEAEPDAGLHAAAEWLLRQWGQTAQLTAVAKTLRTNEEQLQSQKDKRQWYVNTQGQTMVLVEPGEFQMGTPKTEPGRNADEVQHLRKVGRRFAIAAHEVTKEQFGAFQKQHPETKVHPSSWVKTDDSPQVAMTWYEAAAYCNWLSEQEGIPKDEWCYEPNDKGKYGAGMKAKEKALGLKGYRLPTEGEWEYACRAGALTSRYYGLTDTLLSKYAWFAGSGENRTWPVASLKPNDAGLFDMQGNAIEWCHDVNGDYRTSKIGAAEDPFDTAPVTDADSRVLRGGSFSYHASLVRSGFRYSNRPGERYYRVGIRAARTYP